MRLLVVSQYFWPEDFRINELVAELVRRGHDICVLTGVPNYPEGRTFPEFLHRPSSFSDFEGARVVRVPMVTRGRRSLRLMLNYVSFALSGAVIGAFRLRGVPFDAIFVFEPSPVTVGLPAIVLRRLKRAPVAFWVLDQWPETLVALGVVRQRTVVSLLRLLVSFIYSHCDLILVPAKGLIPLIRRYSHGRREVLYFPNWAESAYGARDSVPAPEVPLREGSFDVLFAGNIGESQDFPALLDAAELLKSRTDIRWLIVGDGRKAGWVRAEVERRGLRDTFVLLGRYTAERMPSFYRHASALLVSLRPDPVFAMTIPGKIQSYLAYGLPVVAMLDGEGARVIEEAGAGLACSAGSAEGLADLVVRLSAMTSEERAAMASKGRQYARREFDRDLLVGRLEALLVKLAKGARGSAVE